MNDDQIDQSEKNIINNENQEDLKIETSNQIVEEDDEDEYEENDLKSQFGQVLDDDIDDDNDNGEDSEMIQDSIKSQGDNEDDLEDVEVDENVDNVDNDHEDEDDQAESSFEEDDLSFIDDMLEQSVDVESLKQTQQQQPTNQNQSPKKQTGNKRKFGQDIGQAQPAQQQQRSKVETKQKSVLIKRGHNLFEILPEGWVEVTHFSGLPIYLDKKTRVCTTTKPYHLGTGSARKHHIPLSAIPCLQYRKELDKEKQEKLEQQQQEEQAAQISETTETTTTSDPESKISNSTTNNSTGGTSCLTATKPCIAKVETMEQNKKEKSLDSVTVREYCSRLFEFKTVTVKKFTNWAERRKHEQTKRMAQRPTLPESTKLITCTIPKNVAANVPGRTLKKEFVMNPVGKSAVCILHEYVQHTERTQPKYVFEELEKASKPYRATVFINDREYGKGSGVSKKEAKSEAARKSLDILIPDLKTVNADNQPNKCNNPLNDLNFFDDINIEDHRVNELCLKTGQYTPYQILVECIKRLYGIEDMDIKIETKVLSKHQKIEFKMTVGNHFAVVYCKNKKEGKQRAAQKILKILHPNLKSWGSLLKLYGQGSCKTTKEKKEEAQKITELQNNACSNRPNYAILNKLKEEMLKLRERDQEQVQHHPPQPPPPVGVVLPPCSPSTPNLNCWKGAGSKYHGHHGHHQNYHPNKKRKFPNISKMYNNNNNNKKQCPNDNNNGGDGSIQSTNITTSITIQNDDNPASNNSGTDLNHSTTSTISS